MATLLERLTIPGSDDGRFGPLNLKNRVVMAPLTRGRAGVERLPNALMAEYYAQRAEAGLIISEATSVNEIGLGWNESPGIYTEAQAVAWQQVTDAVHAAQGLIFCQLWHCGRASHSLFHPHLGVPVAPSAIAIGDDQIHTPQGKMPYETPRPMQLSDIEQTIADYQRAARLAMLAGFDGVEIHGANGYLIDEFLQDTTNQRTDEYGGSVENRCRLLMQIIDAITAVWPACRVGVRLSPNGSFNDMGDSNPRALFLPLAQQLATKSLAYLHIMDGLEFGFHGNGGPIMLSELRSVYPGVIIGNVGYTRDLAQMRLSQGDADLIAFGRPFITNPDLVRRIEHDWPWAPSSDMRYWYTPGAKGYTDYAPYEACAKGAAMPEPALCHA
ncbi:MAG: alkene reductase [Vampirovibrionales bacterium]|nr:alkene reductase [Vampirovibrionales bacterium]